MINCQSMTHLLRGPGVHCRDPAGVLKKISKMKEDGPRKLQVFSDFDHTLTRHIVNGKPGCTSYGVLETSSILPEEYRQKAAALCNTYWPIEISHDISKEKRIEAMEQWWHSSHALLVNYKVSKTMLSEMVHDANIALREGHEELFTLLNVSEVPLVIFSAGIGDIILETLKQKSSNQPNFEIVSNRMIFDGEGILQEFSEPVIHSINKGSTGVAKIDHISKKLQGRRNVLLLGDSQGDPFMVDELSVDEIDNVLRIGYLNHGNPELLPIYQDLYDVVLNGENVTLNVPNSIVQYILVDF